MKGRLGLIVAWTVALGGCADSLETTQPDGAADATLDAQDSAQDSAQDARDAAAEVAVADVETDVTATVDAAVVDVDAGMDAAPDTDAADVVADTTATDAAVADSAPDAKPDTAPDAADAADVPYDSGLDPQCPFSPDVVCLHWGVCKGGGVKVTCTDGEPDCDYSGVAGYEVIEKSCDGLDNDCNNLVDDDLPAQPASLQGGVCSGLNKTCTGKGGWKDPDFAVVLPLYQTLETACDGLDNDCDGATDLFAQPTKLNGYTGVCAEGEMICAGALGWQVPELSTLAFYEPVETMCDGLDNDCDGLTDEDMDTPNFLGSGVTINNQGVCNFALIRCVQGVWSAPDYSKQPDYEAIETSCDGLDNDCDGLTDEVTPGLASKQAGVCAGALLVCSGQIGWQDPNWTQLPGYGTDTEWLCDGLDNDCDGLTDEDAACPLWQVGGRGTGSVALSPDGTRLAWTTAGGAQVVDWQTGEVTRNWFGHDHAVTSVAFSSDGAQLLTTGLIDVLQVWPLAAPLTPTDVPTPILAVGGLATTFAAAAFAPDGGTVAAADAAATVHIYALWSGQQVAALVGHKAAVTAVAWPANDQGQNGPLLTGDAAGVLRRWQVAQGTGAQIAQLNGSVRSMADLPGTTWVLVVTADQALVIDATDGGVRWKLDGGAGPWAAGALTATATHEALLLAVDGHVARFVLPAPTPLPIALTPTQSIAAPAGVVAETAAGIAARGDRVAVGFVASGAWRLDVKTGAWQPATARHDGAIRDAAVTGDLLVTGGDDTAIRLWRMSDAQHLLDVWGHEGAVLAVQPLTTLASQAPGSALSALLGTGFWLASGSDDFTVRIWSLTPTAGTISVLTPKIFGLGGPWPQDLARSVDGAALWAAGGPTLSKFATDPAKLGQKLNAYPTKLGNLIERVVPSPDGQWLALGLSGDGVAANIHYRVINAKTFAVLHEWSGLPAPVHAVAWSPDSARLAFAAQGGLLVIADVQSGAILQQLTGHTDAITSLSWSPGGRLLSTSNDGNALVWRVTPGLPVVALAAFSRHCPTPCPASGADKVAVLGGVWRDDTATRVITFGSDGSLIGWKAPASP